VLLPTVLIIAVNLALGFLVAVGRERLLVLRAGPAVADEAATATPETSSEQPAAELPAEPVQPDPASEADAAADPPVTDSAATNFSAAIGATSEVHETSPPAETAGDDSSLSPNEVASGVETADTNETSSIEHAEPGDAVASDTTGSESPVAETPASVPAAEPVPEFPTQWFDLLGEIEAEGYGACQSFVEAATQVLRLEVGRYRTSLVEIDTRMRTVFKKFDANALATAIGDLEQLNADWLVRQNEALGHLMARRDRFGDLHAAGDALEKVLLDQTSQIETTASNIARLDRDVAGADITAKLQRPLNLEVCRLLDMAHALRDQLHESLLAIVDRDHRLPTIDARLHVDALTGFHNRTGLEADLEKWCNDDPHRVRQLSLAMFDIVHVARVNDRHGAAVGDQLIAAVSKVIDGTLRKKRGCDQVSRHSGQRFVVLLGDTGLRNAGLAAERIRQMIAATTFELAGDRLEVLVSCGVAEVRADVSFGDSMEQLLRNTNHAKTLGRNTTCLDEGAGPAAIVDPPHYEAKGQIVQIETE
jgi:diguanylate cyclase (GGDEF)-like protein